MAMHVPKPTDDDRAAFRALVPDRPDVTVKPMFGSLGAFVNGTMFLGLFGPTIGVRLPAEDREVLLSTPGSGPFGPPERPMREYVSLPPQWRTPDSPATQWVERALAHVAALPPPRKRPRKR